MFLELKPATNQKSFYGKAKVEILDSGEQVLYSYDTPIMKKLRDGTYIRLWSGWSATAGKHIRSFSGLNKAQFLALEKVEERR